jgi:hypothetical protein
MGRLIALVAALVLGALIAWRGEQTPAPRPASAPATDFSAGRAMADVAAVAPIPHPVGSAENRRVRDHLLTRMSALGLSPQVRPGVGVLTRPKSGAIVGGPVENVVGVLPGRDRSQPAVALMAHYDSVPGSPGAADDAAGTAAALEIVRAIKARGVPARDVMLVITDGEEAGLLGANHFFRRDPLARRIGLVFNMEARGGGGRAQMFQTSPQNGALVGLLQRAAVQPVASSLTVFIYERLPNDTDLTETLAAKIPGLNYAFIDRLFDYHSPSSTVANLQQGSLQDMGDQVLAAAGAAAFAPALPGKSPSRVYSSIPGGLLVAYPDWAGWVVWLVSALLVGWAARRARLREAFPWTDAARGAGGALFAVLGGAALLEFARQATGASAGFMEQRFLLAQAGRWEAAVMLCALGFLLLSAAELARGRRIVALLPLLLGVAASAFHGLDKIGLVAGVAAAVVGALSFGRPVSRPGAWTGVLFLGLIVALVAQALAPPAAYVFAWPLAVGALAAALTDAAARRGVGGHMILGLLAALGLGWVGGFAHGGFVSMDLMPLVAIALLPAALVLWPLAQPADGAPPMRWLGAVLVAAGLAVTAWVRFADPYDARHPQAAIVNYHADLDTRRAWRTSATPDLPAWSKAALAAGGQPLQRISHWVYDTRAWAAPAPWVEPPAPTLGFARRADGALVLHAAPSPGSLTVVLRLRPEAPLVLESANGVAAGVPLKVGAWTVVRWAGSADGADLVLRPTGPGALTERAASTAPGWPAGIAPLPRKPADVMAWGLSDATVTTLSRRYAW